MFLQGHHHLGSNNELMLSIKELLKDRYRRKEARMLSLLWDDDRLDYPLDGYCIDLKVEEKDLMGTFPVGNIISSDLIFFSEDEYGRRSKRQILITADAGYGKTTLAKKLSYDWATLDPGSYISHFDMVVNIPLITMEHQTLEKSIQNTLDIDELSNRIIISMELRWLIILDGLDEVWNPNLLMSFLKDSVRRYYPNSTIIITSRPYAVKDIKNIFDRCLFISRLSKENQRKYIEAVFSPNTDKEQAIVKKIESNGFLRKASECPLLLHIMCCVYGIEYNKENSSITSRTSTTTSTTSSRTSTTTYRTSSKTSTTTSRTFSTTSRTSSKTSTTTYRTSRTSRTTLYLQILKLLRIFYIKKHGKPGTKVVLNDIFLKLGKVSHRYLRSFNLITEEVLRKEFSKEEEYNVVLRVGILLCLPIRFNRKVILKYNFFHRTFAEFLEAIYIVDLTKQSSQDLYQVLPTSDNFRRAIFVAGLMGRKFVKHKPILLWISGNRRTLWELAVIKNESNLDYESWELVSSLIYRIEYNGSFIERNLLRSGYTLTNFRVIKINTRIVNRDFWKCVKHIIHESNLRADISIELPVSVVELSSFDSTKKIRFINMETTMKELIHISNLLIENGNRFSVRVYIYPANIIHITEGKYSRTANRTTSWNKPVGLLAKSFCPVSRCHLNGAGGTWRFGKIEICYCRTGGYVNAEESERECVSIIPILVITEAQYCSIRKEYLSYHDRLRVVDFKDVSMCRTFDDLREPQYLGQAQSTDVFKRLRRRRIDLYQCHDWGYDHKLVNTFEITAPSLSNKQFCIIV